MSTHQQIKDVGERYEDACGRADATAVAATFTEDATVHFAGTTPIHGRKAIAAHHQNRFEDGKEAYRQLRP